MAMLKSITMVSLLHLLVFYSLFDICQTKKETLSDLYSILDKPELLAMLQKRLKNLEDDLTSSSESTEPGCFDTSGVLDGLCNFSASNGTIIKTTESLAKGASFLEQFTNVTCPRECNALCCDNPQCDTSVYQDKVSIYYSQGTVLVHNTFGY